MEKCLGLQEVLQLYIEDKWIALIGFAWVAPFSSVPLFPPGVAIYRC